VLRSAKKKLGGWQVGSLRGESENITDVYGAFQTVGKRSNGLSTYKTLKHKSKIGKVLPKHAEYCHEYQGPFVSALVGETL